MTQQQAFELQKAIHTGDVSKAQQLAQLLAEMKANIVVTIGRDPTKPRSGLPKRVSLKVNFEDRLSSRTTSTLLELDPSSTFNDLKNRIHLQFGFLPQLQNCIVGKLVPKDDEVLGECGLNHDGAEVFVYILSDETKPGGPPIAAAAGSSGEGWTPDAWADLYSGPQPQHIRSSPQLSAVPVTPSSSVTSSLQNTTINHSRPSDSPQEPVWSCKKCTYANHFSMVVCEMCEEPKDGGSFMTDGAAFGNGFLIVADEPDGALPDLIIANDYSVPEQPRKKGRMSSLNYDELLAAEYCQLIENKEPFECPICFCEIASGCGVVLRDCLHTFCRKCLADHIGYSENAVVTCPFDDRNYQCNSTLQDREIRALVTDEVYERHLQLSTREAESRDSNSYHCATPDCSGWCSFDDDVNTFFCYACRRLNCLTCRAVHDGQDCIEYQRELRAKMYSDPAAMIANSTLEELLKFGDAMKCPQCQVVIIKKDGCDWIQCTVCKTEICWVTQQRRWGPKGRGDTSGGCRCRVNGKLCHPNCHNCH